MKMKLPFESDEAREVNKKIFETIYFASARQSMELAKTEGLYFLQRNNADRAATQKVKIASENCSDCK